MRAEEIAGHVFELELYFSSNSPGESAHFRTVPWKSIKGEERGGRPVGTIQTANSNLGRMHSSTS